MSRAARHERALRAQTWAATLSAAARTAVARASREPSAATARGLLRRAAELQHSAALEYDFARRLLGV